MQWLEVLKALLFGVVEGITEWLPISSTGHLIILESFMGFSFEDPVFRAEFWEMFEVVIQLGAVLAVVVLFWHRLWPFGRQKSTEQEDFSHRNTWILWGKIVVACLPAAFAGIVLDKILEKLTDKDIDGWLYCVPVVVAALIVYGVLFILIEKWREGKSDRVGSLEEISWGDAFRIGCFQAISIIPGTSRSGSTILGAMCLGLKRSTAAEFSFFLALPVMAGASLIKCYGFFKYVIGSSVTVPGTAWVVLAVGFVTAFGVSMAAIRYLMDYVRRHSFAAFGVYRIVLGVLVILRFALIR